MPSEASTPRKDTWRDWIPEGFPHPSEDELITREEVLQRVQAEVPNVRLSSLRHWEYQGVLPRPLVKHRHRAKRSLFPVWVVPLAIYVDELRRDGDSWDEIRRFIKAKVSTVIQEPNRRDAWGRVKPGSINVRGSTVTAHDLSGTSAGTSIATGELSVGTLDDHLIALAKRHKDITGTSIARVDVRLYDAAGKQRGRRSVTIPD